MRTALSFIIFGLLGGGLALFGQTPEEKGYAIAKVSDDSDNGFQDSTVNVKMILSTANGQTTERIMRFSTLERVDNTVGDKSIITFGSPADIKGTALLSHAKLIEPDDQWLYLPALKRVKRISSKNKSGPFVGSEFAFEDFTALELGKYDYKYLRSEEYEGMICDVIERYPRYEFSGYTKQISWLDQEHHQIRKVDFYDRKGALLKSLNLTGYREYEGGIWRSHKFDMINHQTGKNTVLLYSKYVFAQGLSDLDFVSTVLNRGR